MGTEYPKRIYVPQPPVIRDGQLVEQPTLSVRVKNAEHEARWLSPPAKSKAPQLSAPKRRDRPNPRPLNYRHPNAETE